MNKRHLLLSVLAVSASLGLGFAPPADAADFGGNCCADLEERIAELEATTARKGNRKVSLTISGYINEAVMFWDDGQESNAYVVTNDSGRTRVRFRGAAKITADWEAGYRLELGFRSARSDRVDQGGFDSLGGALRGNQPGEAVDVRYSAWYVKNKMLGTVNVGFTHGASQNVTESNVSQTDSIAKESDVEDHIAGFRLRAKGVNGAASLSGLEWRRLIKDDGAQAGDGARGQFVTYHSPSVAGISFDAAWGNDDFWDVGLHIDETYGDFVTEGAIAYSRMTNANGGPLNCIERNGPERDAECHQVGGSLSVLHAPTGLFATIGAGWFEDLQLEAQGQDGVSTFWALQTGIEKKWISLGKTTLYGEYFKHNSGFDNRTVGIGDAINPFAGTAQIFESELVTLGGGIIQGIDAAAMRLYLIYRHYEADVRLTNGVAVQQSNALEDVDVLVAGGLIKF